VNTNSGAAVALQNLNTTARGMEQVQSRINTGLKVSGAKDDSAAYAVAQKLRGDLGGLRAVGDSLSRAKSTVDVALAGAESISDVLNQMKTKATNAADVDIDQATRDSLQRDFNALRDQIGTFVKSADFNGSNLLDGGTDGISALKSIQDGDTVTADYQVDAMAVANQDLALGTGTTAGAVIELGDATTFTTAAEAETVVQDLDDSISNMATVLSTLGSAARQIDTQMTFNSKLADTIEGGVGALVDADLAKESANLQSLQIKQQLGVQALSIANQAPQSIMGLFR
jgi:flagellin